MSKIENILKKAQNQFDQKLEEALDECLPVDPAIIRQHCQQLSTEHKAREEAFAEAGKMAERMESLHHGEPSDVFLTEIHQLLIKISKLVP